MIDHRLLVPVTLLAAALPGGCAPQPTETSAPMTDSQPAVVEAGDPLSTVYEDALLALKDFLDSDYAGYRANAIEGLSAVPEEGAAAARHGLLDANAGVRFVAAMSIGMNQFADAVALVHPLLRDPDDSVRAAAIFALAKNGHDVDLNPLATLLAEGDLTTRANVALVLGHLGDPGAIPMLREALGWSSPLASLQEQRICQLQIAEAMIMLGEESAVTRVRPHLFATSPADGEVAVLAIQILGRVKARRYAPDLLNIVNSRNQYTRSAEMRLAAMGALAQMGEPVAVAEPMEYFASTYDSLPPATIDSIRAQAVHVLGEIGTDEAAVAVADIFTRRNESVIRIQAAAACLRLHAERNAG